MPERALHNGSKYSYCAPPGNRRKLNTGGGNRTHTGVTPRRILSPLRLPFRHAGDAGLVSSTGWANDCGLPKPLGTLRARRAAHEEVATKATLRVSLTSSPVSACRRPRGIPRGRARKRPRSAEVSTHRSERIRHPIRPGGNQGCREGAWLRGHPAERGRSRERDQTASF